MPTDTLIVVTLICLAFLAFAGSLAWMQRYVRSTGKP